MSFVPNRDLLNPKFEGYKLSDKQLYTVTQNFNEHVHKIDPQTIKHFSYQHVRQATMYNHLISDPWNETSVYWISGRNQNIMCGTLLDTQELIITTVYYNTVAMVTHRPTNSGLFFLSNSLAVFHCTVNDNIYIYYTGIRGTSSLSSWQLITTIPLVALSLPEVTLHSANLNDIHDQLDLLTFSLNHNPSNCRWDWNRITFSSSLGNISDRTQPSYDIIKCCAFTTDTICTHSQFINEGTRLMIISDSLPYMENVIQPQEVKEENDSEDEMNTHGLGFKDNYTWEQTETDITIHIHLPNDIITKRDIVCHVEELDQLLVGLNDGTVYVRGTLWSNIDNKTSTWIISDNKMLQVTLEKINQGIVWPLLLKEEQAISNELPLQIDTSENVHQLLSEMRGRERAASNNHDSCNSPNKQPITFQSASLEDCDTVDDKDHTVYVLSVNGSIVQKVGLCGKQLLFTLPSIIALRHDIDALLYTLSSPPTTTISTSMTDSISLTHSCTLHALGYVQASKRDKKFLTSSRNGSCTALADTSRHVFIYLQPVEQGSLYACQYVHTLPHEDCNILGLRVTNNKHVYILTDNSLIVCII